MADRHYVPCIVTGNAIAVSKEKKTPSVRIVLKTTDAEPRSLWADLWLTDNAFEATLKTLEETFGWEGEKLSDLNEPILKDLTCDAVCEWEQITTQSGQLEWKEKVVFLNRTGGGGGVKKLDPAEVQGIVGRLDGLLSRHRQNRGTKSTTPPPRRSPAPPVGRPAVDPGMDFPPFAPPTAEGGF